MVSFQAIENNEKASERSTATVLRIKNSISTDDFIDAVDFIFFIKLQRTKVL